jgi:hypothetical protein
VRTSVPKNLHSRCTLRVIYKTTTRKFLVDFAPIEASVERGNQRVDRGVCATEVESRIIHCSRRLALLSQPCSRSPAPVVEMHRRRAKVA